MPKSPPEIIVEFVSITYVNREFSDFSNPIWHKPIVDIFQKACTIALFQKLSLSYSIKENMIPTRVPAITS